MNILSLNPSADGWKSKSNESDQTTITPASAGRFHAGNPAYKDPRVEHLSAHLESYSKQLGLVGVTRKLLWEEYIIDYQQGYSYSQFCFHLQQQLRAHRP
ncbi:hypothetical protein HDE68_004276 [Pedobacter cryoconitis]|uniref:Uncharacterized protein n=1 Tax=Pedobacter cryoconitis TaxID=188932 RepID=A0A7W9E0F5_9SPHI|nr:hypothetical protein [Pedobacter cryoconitis]MBB5638347.1 hypothetical protein [Pedobacter cryoconitis]